ncbi:unnamed protein product, partial [Polarella glacialis]
MPPGEALLPATVLLPLQSALRAFFDGPDSLGGSFELLGPARRAEVLANYLCGSSQDSSSSFSPLPAAEAQPPPPATQRKQRRALLTGCFDLTHAGHYNALRQAKAAFPGEDVILVAGVHSDEAIENAKGAPTVLQHDERLEMVKACRWVDEVAGDLPYAVPVSLLDRLGCDVAVHGDDLPRAPGGGGLFDEVRAAGRLHIVKRTEGTSTTMLIGRLLSMSKDHLPKQSAEEKVLDSPQLVSNEALASMASVTPISAPTWTLLPTMSRMALFYSDRPRYLSAAKRVVYAPGEWDLFHVAHVRFLQRARQLGDFLVVGCYDDETIHRKKGKNYPLQTLHERSLNVLACRHVDDVLLGAPWQVTK